MALSTIQTNAARLGQRLQEQISESTRDLTLGPGSYNNEELTKMLQSSASERDKLSALKYILTLPTSSQRQYFPTLIKLISSQNVHFKALLYPFIAIHAPADPDLTLLAINSITKDLRHPSNVYIRILALRTLTRIQPSVNGILPLVVDAIAMAARDSNAYIRNQAAISLSSLPPSRDLLPILNSLLLNPCPSTAIAFLALASTPSSNLWLLFHAFFRTYCRILPDFPPWSQVPTINLLGIYARLFLSPSDPDTELLVSSSRPLLYSQNPPTILAALRAHHLLTSTFPEQYHIQAFRSLLRTQNVGIQQSVLTYILHLAWRNPVPFKPMLGLFLVRALDDQAVAAVKLRILSVLLAAQPIDSALLQRLIVEFSEYVNDPAPAISKRAIELLGQAALIELSTPGTKGRAEGVLVKLLEGQELLSVGADRQKELTSATIHVLLSLFVSLLNQKNIAHARNLITLLAKTFLDDTTRQRMGGEGKAALVWGVGVWVIGSSDGGEERWIPDFVRIAVAELVDTWETQDKEQRKILDTLHLQLTLLAVKLLISVDFSPVNIELLQPRQTLKALCMYILSLAKQSSSMQVRDRARFLIALAGGIIDVSLVDLPVQKESDWGAVPTEDEWQRRLEETSSSVATGVGAVKLRKEQVKVILGGGYRYGGEKQSDAAAKASDSIYGGPLWGTLSAVLERDMTASPPADGSAAWEGSGAWKSVGWAHGSVRWPDWCEVPSGREERDKAPVAPTLAPAPTSFSSGVAPRPTSRGIGGSGSLTPVIAETLANPSPVGSFTTSRFKDMDLDEFYADADEDEKATDGEEKADEEDDEEEEESEEDDAEEDEEEESEEEENPELQGFYSR